MLKAVGGITLSVMPDPIAQRSFEADVAVGLL
jgi:hypothetical protein